MKLALAAYGSRGDTEPCLALAVELQRRGHDVTTAVTVPPELRAYVESAALDVRPYGRHWQELLADENFARMLQNPMGAIPQAVEFVAQAGAEKTSTLTSLAAGADLLVVGMTEQQVATGVAAQLNIPLAALHFFPVGLMGQASPHTLQPWEIQVYDEICVRDVIAAPASDAPRQPFVGALTLQLHTDDDADTAEWIGAGAPPVYFGFGSMPIASPGDMVAVIGAACERLGLRALVCLGPNYSADLPPAGHVRVVREVNHATVFPACQAVVHHGGAGTTAAGLRAGVPALVLWNGLDQPAWAASVKHLAVGSGRPFLESTLDSLTADLRDVLAPGHRQRAVEVARLMTTPADSLRLTADLIEHIASSGGSD